MSIGSLMNNTATVFSWTKTSDTHGGWTRASDARYTSMPCRIQPISGSEIMRYGAERTVVTHKLYCPPDYSAIDHEDEIVDEDSKRYRVIFVRNPDRMDHHTEVEMLELRGDIQ